ncbi:hypothetical protein BRC83_09730 [Halobacteriales archaeon QS_1_68_17]|nr:MAG: hypothetical protein BRC83_09730 [Halobacteriales archaeon QS_1_68_17]
MAIETAYTPRSIWVSDLVDAIGERVPLPTPLAALATTGLVPYALTAAFLWLIGGFGQPRLVAVQVMAMSVAAVGPVLVWHYDQTVFPSFIEEVTDVITDPAALRETVERYERFFCDRYWIVVLPWTVIVLAGIVANIRYFTSIGVAGYTDPAFLLYLVLTLWLGVLTGIGLHAAVTTVLCIRAVGRLELEIDPLHHDGLGGLSTIGYFSIRTTVMNSVGSFALPLAFAIAAKGGYRPIIYFGVGIYILSLAASFLYPTVYVNRRAREIRNGVLEEKRRRIRELQARLADGSADAELTDVETRLRIQTLRNDYKDFERVNLYPLSISIITRLVSSVLLPIAFTLLETYVFTG